MITRSPSNATTASSSSSMSMAPSPPSSTSSYDNQDEWTVSCTAPTNDPSYQTAMAWQQSQPYGLGLSSFPSTSGPVYCDPIPAYQSAYTWQSNGPYPGSFRNFASNDQSSDPRTMWDQSQLSEATEMAYNGSPCLSNCSRPSAMSTPYNQAEDYSRASPMVKLEEPSEQNMSAVAYYQGQAQPMHIAPGALYNQPMTIEENHYYHAPSDMNMVDVKPEYESQQTYGSARERSQTVSADEMVADILDDRKRRNPTKPENANCACEQCGKLFQRSFNLRAHMQTHDPSRTQNHQCNFPKCEKRFVRRTDLIRHEQSVHIKSQIFRCPLCESTFARRDTLRRHVGDGCPKRPEVKRGLRRDSATPAPVAARVQS